MSTGNADIIRRLYGVWNEQGVEPFLEMLHPDVKWRGMDADAARRTFEGRDAVREVLQRLMDTWGHARLVPDTFIEVGNEVVAPITMFPYESDPDDPDVKPILTLDFTEVWTLDGGEIVGYRAYLNREDALASAKRHAGVEEPTPPS